ncbi:MAG: hypothetical protein QOD03_1784 [Verrucomicrobiota bacterium]
MAETEKFWERLLTGTEPSTSAIEMRLVRKRARPFLLLPAHARLAAQTLALYPAQTSRGRLAKNALCLTLAARLPFGIEKISVPVSSANPLTKFLSDLAGGFLEFGILAGNPNAAGRRFIFLLFNREGKPEAIVKVGTSERAKQLIQLEKHFLTNAKSIPGIPRLRDAHSSPQAEALALDFIPGDSPGKNDEVQIPGLLSSWLRTDRTLLISETRVWFELQNVCPTHPLFLKLATLFKNRAIRAAVFHGDFAPWNIKVSLVGAWTVFDWERGDLNGLPGYDWFHYVIQTRILVAHEPVSALIGRLEKLFDSTEFQNYAAAANIAGIEREMALLYLLHHNEVIRPGEGLTEGRELLQMLESKWLAA